ncbi:peptidylprolyl isomerase [bacterium]|nr:peptidylprolyl isomerase [bacterium]
MAVVKAGDTVQVHYTGLLEDGTVFDTTYEKDPLRFTLGEKKVIVGVEKAMIGMTVGEKKRITLSPEEAYGSYEKNKEVVMDKDKLSCGDAPKAGMLVEIRGTDGGCVVTPIKSINGDKITLDANHPLAGKTLVFEIELLQIMG